MAKNVTAQVLGGTAKVFNELDTVQELRDALELEGNFTVTINGEPADNDAELNDYEFVSFAPSVKGGSL